MTESTDRDIKELKNAIEQNSQAIADLTTSIAGLREEVRVGFTKLEGRVNNIETKLDGKVEVMKSELRVVDVKLEERTRIGFWGILLRGIPVLVVVGLVVAFLLS
ncbi:hypothetical protein [Chamaesiphon sp. VAR_48_metabat_403]|uniref:hypothetical protein n=1 Tax=Chamaesiphon sp. VAR_48_metabat_403 TaxID=2964700 RepID=UPI00286D8E36|nr:hypothetical protein [Chamaesiphon sp. VAR_48_metabat_403]